MFTTKPVPHDPHRQVLRTRQLPVGADLTPSVTVQRLLQRPGRFATLCVGCDGYHDEADTRIEFRGYTYTPPFFCLCCGIQVCARQFAWARMCGYCDTARCWKGVRHAV